MRDLVDFYRTLQTGRGGNGGGGNGWGLIAFRMIMVSQGRVYLNLSAPNVHWD